MKYNFITKFSKPHFPNIVIKMSWKCDMAEITWIMFSSQFLHNVMKTEFCTFLKYNADILSNLLVNSGSHLYEKVMKLWCVKICTHFLAHFIWILPPCKKVDDHLRLWWRMTMCPGLLATAWNLCLLFPEGFYTVHDSSGLDTSLFGFISRIKIDIQFLKNLKTFFP